jgi:hypothetical protein
MNILLVIIAVLIVFSVFATSLAVSFGNDLKKKFGMLYTTLRGTEYWQSKLVFEGSMKTFKRSPHMRNIYIRSNSLQPFLLVGFMMQGVGMADPFIIQRSKENDLVISLYIGTGPARMVFMGIYYPTFSSMPAFCHLYVSAEDTYQDCTPTVVIKPHWFQRGPILNLTSWVAKNFLGM